ncbi:MAG: ATP-binding protein [Gammaproteobacteria bacterium]|nr:ATP-binding protein [Gammaproteobacteria bacterium]
MSIRVGEVVAVQGTNITLRIFDESSLETLYYDGHKYKGISIREYIGIKRGFSLIVCIIEGEYLDERRFEKEEQSINYLRKVEAKPIGYFQQKVFNDGIKYMPMIKDSAYLLNESQISEIFSQNENGSFVIGSMLKEEIPVSLPWERVFNSHIGIFGNTGSGKSNTLTKLFTELFDNFEDRIKGKSRFLLIDFNGEYTGNQLISDPANKKCFALTTRKKNGNKFPIPSKQIWNTEILALLFQATANTQTPFLNRVVEGRNKFKDNPDSLKNYVKATIKACFVTDSQKKEALSLMKVIAEHLHDGDFFDQLKRVSWHSGQEKFFIPGAGVYFDDEASFDRSMRPHLDDLDMNIENEFDEIIVRINLQLLRDFMGNYVQYDHIQPLLKRVEASVNDLNKIFKIKKKNTKFELLNVVSLRNCNQATKKIVPLLLAKMFYQEQRNKVSAPPDKTLHFIIDEAHNILSQQSNREHEVWKDYRLELFEEIIKEGRKYGIYVTLSSQRPADISPTIMSQLHNFFLHRLVNDKDLILIDNTISTLDRLSKSLIPNLAKGSCIATGTAFDLPIVLQVDKLIDGKRPDSDDVELSKLWV